MAGIAAAAPSVARWVRAYDADNSGRGASAATRRTPTVPPAAGTPTITVDFPLRGDTLTVALDAGQSAGAVDLVPAAPGASTVRVDVRGAAGPGRLLVLPGSVRVRNVAADTASYRVAVPARVRVVHVEVGSRPRATIPGARLAAGAVHLALAPAAP